MNDMQPDNNPMAHNAEAEANNDREGAMAKADLYKLANYSLKLFKRMDDTTQLESWVQAKITKAADYIASVYHYLEYEMKFSEYGEHLNNAEVMSESQKREILNKLTEAKAKVAELKKAQAEKLKKKDKKIKEAKSCNHTEEGTECPVHGMKECGSMEESFDEKSKVGDTYKTSAGNTVTKTSTGIKHTRTAKPEDDEDYVPPKKEKKTAMTGAERREQKAKDKEQDKESKAYEKKNPGSVKRYVDGKLVNESDKGDMDHDGKDEPDSKEYMDNKDKAIKKAMSKKDKKVDEAAKPDFLDMDKDGNKKEPMKKAVADKKKNPFAKKSDKKKIDENVLAKAMKMLTKAKGSPAPTATPTPPHLQPKPIPLPDDAVSKFSPEMHARIAKASDSELQQMAQNFGGPGFPEHIKYEYELLKKAQQQLTGMQEEEFNLETLNPADFQIEEAQECETCHKDPCECDAEEKDSLNESAELDRMKQFLTRLNG